MRKDVMEQLRTNKELLEFVRAQPHWYRKLSRDQGTFILRRSLRCTILKKRFRIRFRSFPTMSRWHR